MPSMMWGVREDENGLERGNARGCNSRIIAGRSVVYEMQRAAVIFSRARERSAKCCFPCNNVTYILTVLRVIYYQKLVINRPLWLPLQAAAAFAAAAAASAAAAAAAFAAVLGQSVWFFGHMLDPCIG